ncbi:hypothetical protein [Cyanobium sp. Morenito 9A2]|uniref:hypothetical protein n=1 Tax=Cyanobium sp. Morenito 9A2 TaxID=2823718 RepID=UPI0020CFDF2D|nr:hypothetical protein [Cyanobium sp. Morenito 9A2]MCP9848860.1 hypothetical protein [Cyanobium sp. Morenito 9A2]
MKLLPMLCAAASATVAFKVTEALSPMGSAFACSLTIALATFASVQRPALPLWSALLGALVGSLVGAGTVAADLVAQEGFSELAPQRALIVGSLALAGSVSGALLGGSLHRPSLRPPSDLIKAASALTTGVFALFVTLKFLQAGLDPARTLSSRLSTSLTVLVASLVLPGWVAYILCRPNQAGDP